MSRIGFFYSRSPNMLLRRSLAAGCALGFGNIYRSGVHLQEVRPSAHSTNLNRELATAVPIASRFGIRSFVLYQYDSCPFCNKVRAHLDFRKVPYVVVEVDPLFNSALNWSNYKKVPLAVINGEAVGDSTVIIDRIDELLGVDEPGALKDAAGAPAEEQRRWRTWVDERLVRLLTVCIYSTWNQSAQASDYITQRNFSPWVALPAKWVGTGLMYGIARRMKSKYSFPEDVRGALYADLNTWVAAVGPDRPFLGGAAPCAADVAVFGSLRAVRGLDTQRDAFQHSSIEPWFRRMEAVVGESSLQHRVGEAARPLQ